MPQGLATNKTEFQRYLDSHPDSAPSLRRLSQIHAESQRKEKSFGFWVRLKHQKEFLKAYDSWWLKNPGLFCDVYEEKE